MKQGKRTLIVIVVAVVLGISIIGVSFFIFGPLGGSGFQFEQSVWISTPDRIYFQIRADDANISITYTDRADLLYSINVIGYPDSLEAHVMFLKHSDSWGILFTAGRQESIDIVLGTGCFYYLNIIDLSNVNTTLSFSNNAWLNGSALNYVGNDDCDLTLRITDDIRTTDTIGFSGRIICRSLNLEIDTPFEWNGLVDFNESNVTIMELSGWSGLFAPRYKTNVFDGNPSIEFDVEADEVFAWLRI